MYKRYLRMFMFLVKFNYLVKEEIDWKKNFN